VTRGDDPLGRRALFGPPPPPPVPGASPDLGPEEDDGVQERGRGGRRALFSSLTPAGPTLEPKDRVPGTGGRPGQVVVECGTCGVHTPLGLMGLACQLVPSLWVPGRRLSWLMRCPKCRRLTWCGLDWLALLGT
jgi:hypothetical protein